MRRSPLIILLAVLSLVTFVLGSAVAGAAGGAGGGGGTAKPPKGAVAPFVTATLPDPVTSVDPALIHGFDDLGFIQSATVDTTNANCPNTHDAHRFGGTLTLNHGPIVIPCNLVIQAPANTFTWADFINGGPDLSLGAGYPSFEIRAVGNIVGNQRIAGLLYASQQSLNSSTGVITGIDYATGNLVVDTGDPANAAVVQINDPNGRFGRAQTPDARFSVDDANPTIHASTGYPMCVPRTDPAVADDPLCPQANRPKPSVTGQCRNFSLSGIAPPVSGELTPAAAGAAYCSQYVMPSVAARAAADPDPRQQAPFEVGDSIIFSGTLIHGATGPDFISAHTVEANIGIYTMPGTQPSYLAIGDFGVGTADPNAVSINGLAAETQDRIFLESETTDVKTAVDIYMMDVDPQTGAVRNRWATPFEMTGEQNGPLQADGVTPIGGGITTQQSGPQPQRARLRATKAPAGLLSQPTRTVRVAVRSLCTPQAPVNDAAGNPVLTALDTCLNKNDATNQVANGLQAGQYFAPTFEFIFPENVKPGDMLVPFDLWHLPFLRFGEGATKQSAVGPSVGPLEPAPWGPSLTTPGAPTIGPATAGNATATVSWTPPTSDGGSAITGYTITALDGAGTAAATVTATAAASTVTVPGLTNGKSYRLQVAAGNAVGTGAVSALSNAVTPLAPVTVPAAPATVTATAAVRSVTAAWAAPAADGGAPVTGFTISAVNTATGTTTATVTAPAAARTATLTGLANGVSFQVRVTAANTVGAGPAAVSAPVRTPALPGAAAITTTTAHVRSLSLTWTAAGNGGSPVTRYTITAVRTLTGAPTTITAPATARTATLTGLANGVSYRVRVTAANAAGTGPASAWSATVTTPNVPAITRIQPAAAGSTTDQAVISATARWLPPLTTGGSAITGYRVTAYRFSGARLLSSKAWPVTLHPAARSLTFRGLTARGTYRFRVQALNAVGTGAASGYSNLVTAR